MSSPSAAPRTHKSMRASSDERIIAAAIEAFADRGYQRTTLKQIGESAGFTGTLISRRYGSKAGLVRQVFWHILGRLTPVGPDGERAGEQIDDEASARAQLDDFIARYMRDAIEQPARVRALYVLIGESLGGLDEIADEVAEVNRVFRDHLAGYIRLGQQQGEFRADIDADHAALLAVGTLRGVVTQLLAEPDQARDAGTLTHELQRNITMPLLRDDFLGGTS